MSFHGVKMRKAFGKAEDFYRVRLITIKEEIPPEMDWKEGIIYFKPKMEKSKSLTKYRVELIEIDTNRRISLEDFSEKDLALKKIEEVQFDLSKLTKHQFENKYNFFSE